MIVDVTVSAEPSLLEQRYRGLLRVLPRAYRERWADDMADTFLDLRAETAADEETYALGRPGASDVADVMALAVRLRVHGVRGRLDPAAASCVPWGGALRTLAAATLLAHAVLGLLAVGGALWMAGQLAWLPAAPEEWRHWEGAGLPTGTWPVLEFVAPLAWLVAFVALACGRVRAARWWTGAALVPVAVGAWRAASLGFAWTVSDWTVAVLWVLPLAGLVAFHDGAPALRRDPWLGAILAGIVGAHALLLLTPGQDVHLDDVGIVCAAVLAVAVVHLVRLAAGRAAPDRTLAVALLVTYALVLRVASVVLVLHGLGGFEILRTAVYAEAAALAVVAMPLALLAARARRAPAA